MNDNYYIETLAKIKTLLSQNQTKEAFSIINEELSMPYIPDWFSKELQSFSIEFDDSDNKSLVHDEEKLASFLKGDLTEQLMAVAFLSKLNCRNYNSIISDYFKTNPSRSAGGLLISILIEQTVDNEYCYRQDNKKHCFNPKNLVLPQDTKGYQLCYKRLNELLGVDYPSELLLAQESLIVYSFGILPVKIEEVEVEDLVATIVYKVFAGLKQEKLHLNYDAVNKYIDLI